MKKLFLIPFLCILIGCKTKHIPVVAENETATNLIYITKYEKDTVLVEVPVQSESHTVNDSASHLENDYAESTARINADGSLYHDLKTKPQNIPKPINVPVTVIYKDSIRTKTVKVPVPVERDFTIWERISIKWFPWVALIAVVLFAVVFRKRIFALVRRFI